MTVRTRAVSICLALVAAACRTTTTSSPPNLASAVIVHALPQAAWQVVDDEHVAGWVVRFETAAAGDKAYFSVRNEHQQELGVIDVDGRAWRYRAHQRDPDWLGSGTVVSGARNILGASDRAQLVPVDLDSLNASSAR